MLTKLKFLGAFFLSFSLLFVPFLVNSAEMGANCQPGTLCNPLKFKNFQDLVVALLDIIVLIGTPIAAFFIVYAGFLMVTARGNEAQLERGKKAFLWAIVGTVVLLGALLLAAIIRNTINEIIAR